MTDNQLTIPITLANKEIKLILYGENLKQTLIEKEDAIENGEAIFQIKEGCYYEYKIDDGYSLETSDIVSKSKVNESSGRISPNINVGTLSIDVLKSSTKERC